MVYYPAVACRSLMALEEDICWNLPHDTLEAALESARVIACPGEDAYAVFAKKDDGSIEKVYE